MIFYMNAIGTVMFFIICLATGQLALAMPWSGWLVAAVFSVRGFVYRCFGIPDQGKIYRRPKCVYSEHF